jgi:3-dehydroquinate synthetase
LLGARRYLELMSRDKKVVAGSMRFVLLRAIGDAQVIADVGEPDLVTVLR